MNTVGILFSDFGPYHVARIDAFAAALEASGSRLVAYRFYESSTIYAWNAVTPTRAKVITLGSKPAEGIIHAMQMASALRTSMRKEGITTMFLPSYSPLPNMLCIFTARMAGARLVMMNESWKHTERASAIGKIVKRFLIGQFSSAVVGGSPHKAYACDYGLPVSKVFLGYDVVDNAYFEKESTRWKAMPSNELPVPHLPARYFLSLGRFVSKKNLPVLIRAYGTLLQRYPLLDIALVLVGDGEEKPALESLIATLQIPVLQGPAIPGSTEPQAGIVFYPFQQIDKTPLFFSRCEAFILPSMYEEWGLVVNEAMACGSPVIVSENVGCAQDLVVNGKNGYTFNPASVEELSSVLEHFVKDPSLAVSMGKAGYQHIKQWGPQRFAEGAVNAVAAAVA